MNFFRTTDRDGHTHFINMDKVYDIAFYPAGTVTRRVHIPVEVDTYKFSNVPNKEDELVITMGGHNGYTIPFYDKDARRVRDEIENYLHTYSAEKGA